jgi:putative colanic acid biosynthesis acetyltransferase WcaF
MIDPAANRAPAGQPAGPRIGAPRARNDLNASPYTTGEKGRRAAWEIVQATLFRWSPQPLRRWRAMLLRLFGARLGRDVRVHRTARVEMPWRIALGDFATVGREAWLYSIGDVSIGDHATIGPRCVICAGDHDLDDPATPLRRRPVVVGAHAWLGMGVFVGPGVTIGDGAVVGAASAVFSHLPADTVCHGHPARPQRRRAGATSPLPGDPPSGRKDDADPDGASTEGATTEGESTENARLDRAGNP